MQLEGNTLKFSSEVQSVGLYMYFTKLHERLLHIFKCLP